MVENQIEIVDENNLRALQAAIFDMQQLGREHELEKWAAGAQEVLAELENTANFLGTEVDNQIARGEGFVELAQDEIRRVYVESGEILTGVVEDVGEAFAQIREDYDEWIGSIGERVPLDGGGGGGPRIGGAGDPDEKAAVGASGLLFNTSGTTNLTVGEAGTETVAVLRNPRQMLMGGMGGGAGAVIININNPVVRDNSDIEKIARAVEETLRQRALLMRPQ